MSTPATITVYDGRRPIVTIAVDCDGYPRAPAGVGARLLAFTERVRVVNYLTGVELTDGRGRVAFGPECLAAQIVEILLRDAGTWPGRVRLFARRKDANDASCPQYHYTVRVRDGRMCVTCEALCSP